MGKRDDLIALYEQELRERCGIDPDPTLLEKVTLGCGPAIYSPDASVVSASDPEEIALIRDNFLIRKLDLPDSPDLIPAIETLVEIYATTGPRYRAVLYYMLTRHFGREGAYL